MIPEELEVRVSGHDQDVRIEGHERPRIGGEQTLRAGGKDVVNRLEDGPVKRQVSEEADPHQGPTRAPR
jgi:hypothetical protein